MRDHILLYINGKRHDIRGETAFIPLTDYLRYHLEKTGTKVVCAEGDCGACTVLLGKIEEDRLAYTPVNGCIQYLYQLDGCHVVTVEGLRNGLKREDSGTCASENSLTPVQEAMVACNGAQCGYCTPGIVMALSAHFFEKCASKDSTPATSQNIRDALTGNLCRCTGYEAILQAGTRVAPETVTPLSELYPDSDLRDALAKSQTQSVEIYFEERRFFKPVSIKEAAALKAKYPDATLISGGTDVSVFCNKRHWEPVVLISTAHLPAMDTCEKIDDFIVIGGKVTLSQLETVSRDIYPEFSDMMTRFGSPQIKNAGTLAGNIANGSPIGDTLPFLFVTNAEIELTCESESQRLSSRWVNINALYKGYKQLDMKPGELITRIRIPLPKPGEILKLYKVSRREHLDISTFMAAFLLTLNDTFQDSAKIASIKIAYGGVGPVILRLPKTEKFLGGKPLNEQTFETAGDIAIDEIIPIGDVRGSRDNRLQLARNILLKLYWELAENNATAGTQA